MPSVSFHFHLSFSYLGANICCRSDIKPDNLLIHESGSLRIADFGCSMKMDLVANPSGLVSNTAGTIAFWPPEAVARPSTSLSKTNNDSGLRLPEYSHDLDQLPGLEINTLSPVSDSNAFDIDSLPPMMESFDVGSLDDLPPMMENLDIDDLDDLPSMMESYNTRSLDDLPPMIESMNSNSHNTNSLAPQKSEKRDLSATGSVSDTEVHKYSSYNADVWAAGLTIHCFLYGVLPFKIEGSNPVDILDKILDYKAPIAISTCDGEVYSSRPQSTAHVVWSKLLQSDPSLRMTLQQAFNSDWLQKEAVRRDRNSE
jgi:serine/threonine protein kinase